MPYALQERYMILTVPAHEAVTLSKETYSGFGNYFVRELTFEMKKYDLDTDGGSLSIVHA